MNKKNISANMSIAEILSLKPQSGEILVQAGMGCLGCPWATLETLEQGAKAHHWTKKKLEKIIRQINAD